MGKGLSIHVASTVTGLAAIATIVSPAISSTADSVWERLRAIPTAMANDATYQKEALIATGAYVAIRASRSAIEKKPLVQVGNLRIYAL